MKLFDMLTSEDIKRIKEDKGELDLTKRVKELDNSLSIALDINDNYQRENKKLKEKVRSAEGETSIIKAVGLNSPEMRALQARVKELENNRPLNTMDEVAYRELEGKNQANVKEIDRLSEENSNLRLMKKL